MSDPNESKPRIAGSPATRGFAQMFGLDIRAAFLLMLVDLMLSGGEIISAGLLLPLSIAVAAVLGVIVYRIQTQWYGDDHDAALTKALVLGLLTAIPGPLSPLLAIPCGTVGLVRMIFRK